MTRRKPMAAATGRKAKASVEGGDAKANSAGRKAQGAATAREAPMKGRGSPGLASDVRLGAGSVALGGTQVGPGTTIGDLVVLGEPGKEERKRMAGGEISEPEGALIGSGCIVRSHTVIYSRARLLDGVMTGHHVMVREECTVGQGTLVGTATVIDNDCIIGEKVSIQTGVYIPTGTVIGDRVFLGPRCTFTNDKFMGRGQVTLQGAIVEDGARVGANATILPGVVLGADCLIGAGAVVTKDVAPGKVVVGNPARVVGDVPTGHRLRSAHGGRA